MFLSTTNLDYCCSVASRLFHTTGQGVCEKIRAWEYVVDTGERIAAYGIHACYIPFAYPPPGAVAALPARTFRAEAGTSFLYFLHLYFAGVSSETVNFCPHDTGLLLFRHKTQKRDARQSPVDPTASAHVISARHGTPPRGRSSNPWYLNC